MYSLVGTTDLHTESKSPKLFLKLMLYNSFSLSQNLRQNKLDCLFLASLSALVLYLQ